jgi:hypothetical protein
MFGREIFTRPGATAVVPPGPCNPVPPSTILTQTWDTTGNIVTSQTNYGGDPVKTFGKFSFTNGAIITDVHWTGGYQAPSLEIHATSFIIQFWTDVAGAPGVMEQTQTLLLAACNETLVGSTAPGPTIIYTYSADITQFVADAATTFWLAIQATLVYPPLWGWAQNGVSAVATYQDFGGVPITDYPNARAFDFTGCVPT